MALLAMTGCKRTTPTIALETLFELPPLHVFMDIQLRRGDYKGHLKIYEKFPSLVEMREVSDQLPMEFEFDMLFELVEAG